METPKAQREKRTRQVFTDRQRRMLMVRCVDLTYLQDDPVSQNKIADQLQIHASHVSRFLAQAKRDKIIQFKINLPRDEELQLELIRRYKLRDAIVVPIPPEAKKRSPKNQMMDHKAMLGQTAAQYLAESNSPLKEKMRVGISCGETLLQTVLALPAGRFTKLDISPLTVESAPTLAHQAPATIIGLFFTKCSRETTIYGPQLPPCSDQFTNGNGPYAIIFSDVKSEVETRAKNLDIALIGIGTVDMDDKDSGYTQILKQVGVTKDEIEELGIIGEINNRPIDREGIDCFNKIAKLAKYICAIELSVLRDMALQKPVVAIAGGMEKLKVIKAALDGRYLNILITDEEVAENLVN